MYRSGILVVICAIVLSCAGADQASPSNNEEIWQRFLAWWPGHYQNTRQITVQANLPEEDRLPHTRLYIRKVDLPAFGQFVYYAEWQDHADAGRVLRQRFYVIERDANKFRLNLHIFPMDAEIVKLTAGAYNEPSKLSGLTPEDMYPLPGCDVYFQWNGREFVGEMIKGECRFDAPGTSEPIYSWSQMRLGPQQFSYLDGWFLPDDTQYLRLMADWIALDKTTPTDLSKTH